MALAKWYKIDFHVHTPESSCFPDKSIDADTWLTAAKKSGINGVVITDHNSIGFLDKIKDVKYKYEEVNEFKVFYGIEVCVSAEFTHFLIIFNDKLSLNSITDDVVQFLGLRRECWGNTTVNVSEDRLFDLYKKRGNDVFIIPAHFASNKGLGTTNVNAISKYADNITFSAVEVRNAKDNRELDNKIANSVMKSCARIMGSDNPKESDESKHAIEGIGKVFTWVKSATLDFEGLRQAFIDPEYRILDYSKMEILGNKYNPNEILKNYVSGIELRGFKHIDSMKLRFSPHFNCIIGGRGTGKSTFVESIRASLQGVQTFETKDLLKKTLNKDGEITAYYNFGSDNPYSVKVSKIGAKKYNYLYENTEGVTEDPPAFLADIYSQKEIYSLVEDDNEVTNTDESPLIKIIDTKDLAHVYEIKDKLSDVTSKMITESQKMSNLRSKYQEFSVVKSEITSLESLMRQFKESGLEKKRTEFEEIQAVFKNGLVNFTGAIDLYKSFSEQLTQTIEKIGNDSHDDKFEELKYLTNRLKEKFDITKGKIEVDISEINLLKSKFEESQLKHQLQIAEKEYNDVLESLNNTGNYDVSKIENQLRNLKEREKELVKLKAEENLCVDKIRDLADEYIAIRKELTAVRRAIVDETSNNALKITIQSMAHASRLRRNIQIEFGKEETYNNYFDQVSEQIVVTANNHRNLKDYIVFLLTNTDGNINQYLVEECAEARFVKLWKDKKDKNTLSSLLNILPEDRVTIKLCKNGNEIDINEGSPGQKCAAVLGFLLSNGKNPLIIDQPEDDLDNSLIYKLIVDSIRKMKHQRQIIIVSHNPNIPVLGDAEGIIILERNSMGMVSLFKNKKAGCIEEKVIRDGICDIMEGGETAFKKREEKYMYKSTM